ncbi:hypothetical protein DEH80_09605 [Abyssibacter profundi]|uniref:DUF3549 domain-containing protein n=1 Tax=Abyssibacter profundi TaxID=2182787 RepID=A0A363UKY1_9GAMM|nr:hypothetical protein DEH80_09605 [Abyssibacter profundi]
MALLLGLSLATGCSTATRFGYNHLDWFAKREIGKYFDMTAEQEDWFEQRFDTLWQWHRREQLPLYARDLRQLAEQARAPLSRDAIEQALAMVEAHINEALRRATDDTVTMLSMLNDDQVAAVLERIDKNIEDAAEELAEQDDIERREAAAKRVRKWMEERYGRLSREQRNLIDAWAGEREYSPEAWLARSRQWRDALAEALDQRQSSGFADRVTYLLFDDTALVPEPLEAERRRNRHRWLDLAAEISAMTSERQRDHLVEYISDFAEDFEALAQR